MFLRFIVRSPSKTFAIILAMFCFGVLVGPLFVFVSLKVLVIGLLACLFGCAFFSVITRDGRDHPLHGLSMGTWVCLFLFVFLFGIFRYAQSEIPTDRSTVRDAVGSSVRVQGIISGEPVIQGKTQQITIDHVAIADAPTFGRVLVRLDAITSVHYSDSISLNCALEVPEPFNGFDYARFLQAKGILATCSFPKFIDVVPSTSLSFVGTIFSIKHLLVMQMNRLFPEPHASFLFGLVFGGNAGLDKDIQNDFSRTGTSHILAASGFNVSLFTFVFFGWIIQTPLGKKRGAFFTAFLLFVYVIIAGAGAAVIRAAILGSVILFGAFIGRRASILNALLLAAVLILIFNPRVLLDDVGFQLSFAATAAILYVVPRFEKHFLFVPDILGLREALVGSLSAIIITLPILFWQFGSISLVAPFVNLFILPLVPLVMATTLVALVASVIFLPLGFLIAIPAWAGSWFMLMIITIFSSLPFASVPVFYSHALAILSIGIIALLFIPASSDTKN